MAVKAGNIRLDIHKWRAVKDINATHYQQVTLSFQEFDHRDADSIRPARVASGKNAVRCVIQKRVPDQFPDFARSKW